MQWTSSRSIWIQVSKFAVRYFNMIVELNKLGIDYILVVFIVIQI